MVAQTRRFTTAQVGEYLRKCPQILVAEILGLSMSTVQERVRSAQWATVGRASVDLFKAADLERKRLRTGPVSIESARLKRAQALKAEIANQVSTRELILYTEAAALCAEISSTFALHLEALGPRLAPILAEATDPSEIIHALEGEADELRAVLAGINQRFAASGPGGGDSPAAAEAPTGPVGRPKSKVPARKRRVRKVSK